MKTERPNTLEIWLPDAEKWARVRFGNRLSDLDWEIVHDIATLRIVRRWDQFDALKSSAFSFLCRQWRRAYADFLHRKYRPDGTEREHRDCMNQPSHNRIPATEENLYPSRSKQRRAAE